MEEEHDLIMCYQDHVGCCLKRGNELGGYFKTVVEAGFFVLLVLCLFCRDGQGVVVKISSLPLDILNLRCPIDIQGELSPATWTSNVYGSAEKSGLEF